MTKKYIHELKQWPEFRWDSKRILDSLGDVRMHQGQFYGRLAGLGFELRNESMLTTLADGILHSEEMEGRRFDMAQIRSSIARNLGIPLADFAEPERDVEGAVTILLDATQHFDTPLTKKRLTGWQAALFPTGFSGNCRVKVGNYRNTEMQVVSGAFGKEKVHFVAPAPNLVASEMKQFLAWFNKVPQVGAALITH